MPTNGIHSNVVKSVRNLPNNHAALGKTNTTKSVSFADTLTKVQLQESSVSPEIDTSEEISAEDAKYLQAVRFPDGSMIYYPPNNAPIATKRAWIEASKKMTGFQRAMTVAIILFPTEMDPNEGMTFNQIQKRALGVTSYQDGFKKCKQEMEKKLNGTNDSVEKGKCQVMIQAWDILLNTFSKYNVK